ncbi:MAG TPA: aldehyde dehydrogenase family protein, partial [Nitrososphaerales archaeon]|nr:aldehyde dehydrogenase family protein [Nitrososphaerales archaeon]
LNQEFSQRTVGDPMDHEVDMGPLRSQHQLALLESQMTDAAQKGATIKVGGKRREGKGFFYDPTILGNVTPEMKVMQEEVFGPVAPIYVARDVESAVQIANDTEFGLGASIWTNDSAKGRELALRMECGVVFVNELVRSDPRMPFGGIKQSGIGRELSRFGLLEFVNVKSINLYS